jgi:hypothetical protein
MHKVFNHIPTGQDFVIEEVSPAKYTGKWFECRAVGPGPIPIGESKVLSVSGQYSMPNFKARYERNFTPTTPVIK